MRLITLLLLVMFWLPQVSFAVELTPEQQQAKQQGIALFMQGHEAKADLEIASTRAKQGDGRLFYTNK